MDKNDLTGGVSALKKLRGSDSIDEELEEIRAEATNSEDSGSMSVWQLITSPQLRLALFITVCVHLSQQLSGIVAIFYYSTTFFQVSFDNIRAIQDNLKQFWEIQDNSEQFREILGNPG